MRKYFSKYSVLIIVSLTVAGTVGYFQWRPYVEVNNEMVLQTLDVPFDYVQYPTISPDGTWIAFIAADPNGRCDLYSMQIETGEIKKLTREGASGVASTVSISPDGQFVSFTQMRETAEICVVPATGGVPRIVATRGIGSEWHPDGKRVGFIRPPRRNYAKHPELWSVNSDGTDLRREFVDTIGVAFYYSFSWSPDGKSIAWARSYKDMSVEIFVCDLTTGKERQLTFDKKAIDIVHWMSNNYILYSSNKNGNFNLWMISSDGGNPIQLTRGDGPDVGCVASRDLKKILTYRRRNTAYLWKANLENAIAEQVSYDARFVESAVQSTDGRHIIVASHLDELDPKCRIYIMDQTWGERIKIGEVSGAVENMTISPNGTKVAYSVRPGVTAIDSAVIHLVDLQNGNRDYSIGFGRPVSWIDSVTLTVFSKLSTWHLNVETGKSIPFYIDSTLTFSIPGSSKLLVEDFRRNRRGVWVIDTSANRSKLIFSTKEPFKHWISNDRKSLLIHNNDGEAWIVNLDGSRRRLPSVLPGLSLFSSVSTNYNGKDMVYNEIRFESRIVVMHNPLSPPWWKTARGYGLFGLSLGLILFVFRKYEMSRERLKHEAEIEHLEAEKLRELDQMKSRFFANISHEFRTPLTLIEGPARRILSEEGSPKENAHLIVRNSSRLLQLVNQLLDLSRIEAGQLKLRVEQTNLCDLVKGIGAAFETMARKKDIRYKIEVPQREEYGWVDGDAVEKCITNLLSNAMKFTPEGGSVTLAMESDGVRMAVRVTDSGIGIEDKNMQRVFERFYQVDDNGTRQFEGTGIGLALTKDLVELHCGTIGIESTPGIGSTFTMSIPVNKESYTPEQLFEPVTDKKAEHKAGKEDIVALDLEDVRSGEDVREGKDEQDGPELPLILLIEDNEDMRKYIRMHLNGSYEIVEASDGLEGLEKALETVPDLIISDQMMPKMEGSMLVQKVKSDQRISHIPVILLTAKAEQRDKLEGLSAGADDYLVKPFDATELKARMENLIQQRRKLWDKFRTEWMIKPRETHAVSSDEKFLAQVMDIFEKNISDPEFDLNRLAEKTAISRVQLHRKLKALTGLAPGEFIRNYRLDRAAQLLKKKAGNVSEIAFDVGFNNLSYFAKAFREKFGVNPSDF